MLRSSEIKPLFVDLSLSDKSFYLNLLQVVAYGAVDPSIFFNYAQ